MRQQRAHGRDEVMTAPINKQTMSRKPMALQLATERPGDSGAAERFLATFSKIEAHLRREVKADKHVGFSELIARYDPNSPSRPLLIRSLARTERLYYRAAHGHGNSTQTTTPTRSMGGRV
jgi:hypothetical protein